MVREFTVVMPCNMAADEFWALRSDTGFDDFFAKLDKQTFTCFKNEAFTKDGQSHIKREFKLSASENPVPKALRGFLPKGIEDFSLRVNCSFATDVFDEAHPCECILSRSHRPCLCESPHDARSRSQH